MTKTITVKFYYDNEEERLLTEKELQEEIKERTAEAVQEINNGHYYDVDSDFYAYVEEQGISYHDIFIIASETDTRTEFLENFSNFLEQRWKDYFLGHCEVIEKTIEVEV